MRPYGQVLVPLGCAETLTGDPQAALAALEKAKRQGWRTKPLHLEKAAALMLWFGHD